MTAVAARRLADDAALFEHGHGSAAPGQGQRRRQAGEARADETTSARPETGPSAPPVKAGAVSSQ